jgi:phage terminase small subunit
MTQSRLTPKQRRFVDEYLLDLNATQAAVRAGYKPNHARQVAAENLSKPVIADAIAAAQAARSERVRISQDDVLRGLHREATWMGEGASHSARVAAWGLIAKHLGMLDRRQLDENGEPIVRQLFTISIGNGSGPMPLQIDGTSQSALTVSGIDSPARLP